MVAFAGLFLTDLLVLLMTSLLPTTLGLKGLKPVIFYLGH